MKVMLRNDAQGKLSVYVPKKDLEEDVVKQTVSGNGKILTLANGWELEFATLTDETQLPQTFEAKLLS
ncbi:putative nitrogen fixation protein NifT [Crocosphaera sp. UHCC 0190]|uniref:putative nitrogen fixation protein NifT n=1 Tax=unclassified Crocosphaera TaxID=2623705 RepID=UPI002B201C1D|nr:MULTISPECIES: putative nitrogen fixation protein NifT [unclassified Crocosphaera]MEA5508214.1 putative nitrogen fixation protein NifT [Crocosphaera sp. UHCC 0190]MEA5533374.1 putative nitrogen fixation protein NifT [Crocosphaera sp. XPORK-15E]